MRRLTSLVTLVVLVSLAGACAPDLCPGETKVQKFSHIKTNTRVHERKAKPSLIYLSKTTSKRKPPR